MEGRLDKGGLEKSQLSPLDHTDPGPDLDGLNAVPSDAGKVAAQKRERPEPDTIHPDTRKRSRTRIVCAVILGLLVIGISGGLWLRHTLEQRWKWEAIVMPERIARVTDQWTSRTLAERLIKTRKIRDVETFVQAAQQVQLETVAPGAYRLPAKAGPLDLATIFKQPPALLKVTFPEGWTAHQMAQRLAKNDFAGAAEFERLAYPPGHTVSPWEGKLFPDTYYLPHQGTGQELVQRLHNRYREIMATLPRSLPHINGTPMTPAQVTILASLVERETDVPEERPLVAGVLRNRLLMNMPLQCDASVQYARQRAAYTGQPGATGHKARLLYRDLKIESPYNTYRNRGLPPGSICNPGAASLRAAAAPQPTKYLFYVWSPRQRRHRFAETFAGHERNIRLVRAEKKPE